MAYRTITIDNTILTKETNFSYLNADFASGVTALTVDSIKLFAINQVLCIGDIGDEDAEIIKTHGSTAPTGNTVTLVSATTKPHARGTKITVVPFDRIELSHSATATGAKATLTVTGWPGGAAAGLILVDPELTSTNYIDTQQTTGFYFWRFNNSITSVFSAYSDPITYDGYSSNQVGYIKKLALQQLGENIGDIITDSFLNEALWEGRREVDSKSKKWSFRTEFNKDLGNITTGMYRIATPTELANPSSPDNILGLRIGSDGRNLRYISKRDWDRWYDNVPHTTVATQPAVGDTSLVITNSRDFGSSGSVTIGTNVITYTANAVTTGTLSGIPASGDGSITATHAVATDVWQNASFSWPSFYTIFEDYLYFNCPIESTYDGQNIWIDIYRSLPVYNSDYDTLDETDTDMYVSYLKFKIKYLKSHGKLKMKDDQDGMEYMQRTADLVAGDRLNQTVAFVPDTSHLIGLE